MSKSKGKGKALAVEENPPSRIFPLKFSELQADFVKLMDAIEEAIKEINENEINNEPALCRKPLRVEGRLYTPKKGTFMVRLEPDGQGRIVHLLFRWSDLYFVGFHVEGVWYYFSDFDTTTLPPQSQLNYNPKDGVGKIKLIFSTRYANIGGYNIKFGKPAFIRCITGLSKAAEHHDNTEGQRALKAGPLSLPMVAISEAIRFAPWRAAVISQLGEEVDSVVEDKYGDNFQDWQSTSTGIACRDPTTVGGKLLTVEEMVTLVRIIKRTGAIKATKVKWQEPSTSK